MAVPSKRLKHILFRVIPILAVLLVLLVALILVTDVQRGGSAANRGFVVVVAVTLLATAVLVMAIFSRVASLLRKVRNEEPGARLAARWVRNFLVFSLPPALIVYVFSAWFLTQTIDSWFDVRVENALADSLALGQEFVDQRTMEVRNQSRRVADQLDAQDSSEQLRRTLLANIRASGPTELTLFDQSGATINTASSDVTGALPERPGDYAWLQAMERGEYAAAEPAADGQLRVRVLQKLPGPSSNQSFLLQAMYPLPGDVAALTGNIEAEYYRYQNVAYLRTSLKQSFLLILTLVMLLTVQLAILAALSAARRMVTPLSSLAAATQRVAGGELDQAVELQGRDEIGFLSEAFNDMSKALVATSAAEAEGKSRLRAQGIYLETVLGSLSSGVMTLDRSGHIVRVNAAADRILQIQADALTGQSLDQLGATHRHLQPLADTIRRHIERTRKQWQEEVRLDAQNPTTVLLVRGSDLSGPASPESGYVVVFDDVTVLNQAQREAAWSEVARRLAHEVKNPLTPIRLAAERLHMKLGERLVAQDAELLERSTSTIVAQVEALRRLVDAFGDYAQEPKLERSTLRLDRLIEELAHLYEQADPPPLIQRQLCPGPEGLVADEGRLRQLLHNLLSNAVEASAPEPATIRMASQIVGEGDNRALELIVSDHGPGYPDAVLERPFEPYVTSKPTGSGLGLAICRKIIKEHDGDIVISNSPEGGASTRITLPLDTAPQASASALETASGTDGGAAGGF